MNPILVEVTRGGRVESTHRGAVAVCDAKGGVVFAAGDIDAAVFPRSAVKAFQALPLIESGAADRVGLTAAEIALACASHGGEGEHTATARSMLAKAGRDEACLECGAHWPYDTAATQRLVRAGETPSALHNNCSGKHSGFICLACASGDDPAGYVRPDHPTMQRVTQALAAMTGVSLDARNRATDGCSIPTYAIPLRALALGFARFGVADGAAARIRAAVAAHPFMVGGTGRFDTVLMQALGARAFVKSGAEGVHCAALPELGLGIAVKCEDGAARAGDRACAILIDRLLGGGVPERLVRPELRNWNDIAVGAIRPADTLAAVKHAG